MIIEGGIDVNSISDTDLYFAKFKDFGNQNEDYFVIKLFIVGYYDPELKNYDPLKSFYHKIMIKKNLKIIFIV